MADCHAEIADVVVIGGGPAGSAAALRLARAGFDVVLLERRVFGSSHNDTLRSGEGILARTQRELDALEVDLQPDAWALHPVRRVAVHWPRCDASIVQLPPSALVHVNREQMDQALCVAARKAGVDTRMGWRVRDFVREGGAVGGVWALPPGATAPQQIRARLVIDAGGRNALSLRHFNLHVPLPGPDFLAMAMFFDDVAGLEDWTWEMHMFDSAGLTVVQLSRFDNGLVRCGLGTALAAQRAAALHPERFFWQQLRASPELGERFATSQSVRPPFVCAIHGYTARHVALDGLMLVGDAAGYVNPLFGDGIWRGLRDARAAATTAAQALRRGHCSQVALAPYARRHAVRSTMDRLMARAVALGYATPGVLNTLGSFQPAPAMLLNALTR